MADARRGRWVFMNAGHFYAHLAMLIYPTAVIAMEEAFAAGYAGLLPLATAGFVAFGAGSLPAGWLGDRWSRRGMMAAFFLGTGACLVLTGLAREAWQVAAGLLAVGLFASVYHPVGIPILLSGEREVGRLLGINGVFGNLGMAAAPVAAGGLADLLGWRGAFLVPGALGLVAGAAYLACRVPVAPLDGDEPPALQDRGGPPRAAVVRALAVLAVATTLSGLTFIAMTVALPKLVATRAPGPGEGLAAAGALASAILAVAALAQIPVGRLADRLDLGRLMAGLMLLQLPCLAAMAVVAGTPFLAAAAAMLALMFGEIPVHDTLVARCATETWRGRVYAVKYVLSLGVSAAAVPLVAAAYAWAGFELLFALAGAFAVAIVAAAGLLPGPVRRPPETPARSRHISYVESK